MFFIFVIIKWHFWLFFLLNIFSWKNVVASISRVIFIDDAYDLQKYNCSGVATNYTYAETAAYLPASLELGDLDGRGIFYFQGGQQSLQWYFLATSATTTTDTYACPAVYSSSDVVEYVYRLPPTQNKSKWGEEFIVLDLAEIKTSWHWMGFEAVGFSENEYFLLDQIILFDGVPPGMATTARMMSKRCSTRDDTTTTESPKDGEALLWIVVGISLIVGSCAVTSFFIWHSVRGLKNLERNLSDAEVSQFYDGSPFLVADDKQHAPIYSLPYPVNLEIPRDRIKLGKRVGSGQFGIVMEGYIIKEDGSQEDAAIKTLDPNVDVQSFKAFLSEIKIMSFLQPHPNILLLIGACTASIKKRQVFAVVEYCANHDLLKYLQSGKVMIMQNENTYYVQWSQSVITLISFCIGIANGMKYLTDKNVVHGDLAARNILLTENLEIKISDFGLSRQLHNYSVYQKKQMETIPLPVMWMAIEALKSMKFSVKSDVWSFGVVLWEIFSMGDSPAAHFSTKFIENLMNGKRLKKPGWANDHMYKMMLNCWNKEPDQRPTFEELHFQLEKLLSDVSRSSTSWFCCTRSISTDKIASDPLAQFSNVSDYCNKIY